jgi:hypothetical protein
VKREKEFRFAGLRDEGVKREKVFRFRGAKRLKRKRATEELCAKPSSFLC